MENCLAVVVAVVAIFDLTGGELGIIIDIDACPAVGVGFRSLTWNLVRNLHNFSRIFLISLNFDLTTLTDGNLLISDADKIPFLFMNPLVDRS